MKYAFVFTLFGATCGYYAATVQNLAVRLLAASFAVAFTGVGLAYAFLGHRTFLKKSSGQLSPLSYVLFWPYHLLNIFGLMSLRRSGKENAYNKIDENVYLGCRLSRGDEEAIAASGIASVLDLTCEFSEFPLLRERSYRCIPILDTRAPTLQQLRDGAQWIRTQAAYGPVYVHCAMGHGRSATFVAAYLLFSGKTKTAQEAVDFIKAIRPKIGLSMQQMALLKQMETAPDPLPDPQE